MHCTTVRTSDNVQLYINTVETYIEVNMAVVNLNIFCAFYIKRWEEQVNKLIGAGDD
jgi:hypothetical protein